MVWNYMLSSQTYLIKSLPATSRPEFTDRPRLLGASIPLSLIIFYGFYQHAVTTSQNEQLLPLKPVDLLDSDETLVESALHSEYVFEQILKLF